MKFHITPNKQVICELSQTPKPLTQIPLTENINLFYVIQRFKHGRSKHQTLLGDNCPFLYGLKQLDGLYVEQQHKDMFYQFAVETVQQYFQDNFPFDCIVLLPSSHTITNDWAKQLPYDIPIYDNIFKKKFNYEVKQEVIQLYEDGKIEKKIHEIIIEKCIADNNIFSLKHIPVSYRQWIKPFKLHPNMTHNFNDKRILLVDDICSSGRSLVIAHDILLQTYDQIKDINALTLFGKI